MLQAPVIVAVAFAYLCLLFAIAYYADKRADARRNPQSTQPASVRSGRTVEQVAGEDAARGA